MKRRKFRNNPERWVTDQFLEEHWAEIRSHVNSAKLMPDRRNPEILGCGRMGCVYQTQTPGVAMKITFGDWPGANEFDFTNFAIRHPHPGLVRFFTIININEAPGLVMANETKIIWRSTVDFIGSAPDALVERCHKWSELVVDYKAAIQYIDDYELDNDDANELTEDMIKAMRSHIRAIKRKYRIGQALEYYWKQGWLVGDLHNGNLAMDDEGHWVIFDFLAFRC